MRKEKILRKDSGYNDYDDDFEDSYEKDELERQREIIARKIRTMSGEDSKRSGPGSTWSSAGSSRSSHSSGSPASSASKKTKVRQVSPDEIDNSVRKASSSGGSSYGQPRRGGPGKKHKKKRRGVKIFASLVIIFAVIAAVFIGAVYYMLGGLTRTDLEGDLADTGGVSYIKNIALFGVDTRDAESSDGRSDAIMIMSVNKRTGEINLISILRDSYVAIEGYSNTKINSAYAYGGASLAVKTLNQNFGLDITDYVTVNFAQLAQIIDATGGVTIEITAAEAEQINKNLDDAADEDMTVSEVVYVEVADGTVTLNGDQAVAYSRIRKIDSDNVRASRQQTVLSAVLDNIMDMSVLKYPSFIREFMSISESSLSTSEILSFAPMAFKKFTINTYTVPDINYETDLTSGYDSSSQWCWFYDLDGAAERIHEIIYGD